MATLKKNEISRLQAERRTAQHKRDFATLKKGWMQLGKAVERSVQMGVPAAMGMNMRAWLEQTFQDSASHIFRELQSYRALKGIPESTLEAIPEASAHELTRLKEKDRKDPKLLSKAVSQTPKEFKETVAEIRETQYHIPRETWKTWAVRVPVGVYDNLTAAQEKMARVLELDLADEQKRIVNVILVWESVAAMINNTPEVLLKVETVGGGPSEEQAVKTLNLPDSAAKSAHM